VRKATGIIPARYGATRFPGKPLAKIAGKWMIQRVYEQAKKAKLLQQIIIATDDERIFSACRTFGADVRMTSPDHCSGTERVAEVAEGVENPVIINIQGDEPLLQGQMIDDLIQVLQDPSIAMVTLASRVTDLDRIHDKDIVKVAADKNGNALYFSRSPIPFRPSDYFLQHIGIYGYQKEFLLKFRTLPFSRLEATEGLEQLRVLENGNRIKIVTTSAAVLSVDNPQDIMAVEKWIQKASND
jgi:3-deoxy-manno-octulosonate cytidylyltransferase (CMP-KDO synthetase)